MFASGIDHTSKTEAAQDAYYTSVTNAVVKVPGHSSIRHSKRRVPILAPDSYSHHGTQIRGEAVEFEAFWPGGFRLCFPTETPCPATPTALTAIIYLDPSIAP